jgi:predicted cupin superfamily sugar epimerase
LESDEIWHFYKGSAVKIHVIDKEGNLSKVLLGDFTKTSGASFHVIIKAGDWFAAENVDKTSYCLVGCTVSPGFEYVDFKLADREKLSLKFPQHSAIIERLTRHEWMLVE